MPRFTCRPGIPTCQISVPVSNVYALYGRETGHGMTFDVDAAKPSVRVLAESEGPGSTPGQDLPPDPPRPAAGGRPALRRVK